MALETVVFSQQDLFMHSSSSSREWYAMGGGTWADGAAATAEEEEEEKGSTVAALCRDVMAMGDQDGGDIGDMVRRRWDFPSSAALQQNVEEWDGNYSTPEAEHNTNTPLAEGVINVTPPGGRRKRRRTKAFKNKEEVENQRMTHIAVERNRRKQMNEYLAVLRSLMPPSYVQRGDQASIIGGAINFVKELEQLLQSLEAKKLIKQQPAAASPAPFADFFSFPQYSMRQHSAAAAAISTNNNAGLPATANEAMAANHSATADIEVTMVESHANIKVLSRRRTRQLLRMVVGLQNLRLTALHLNVTTVDQMVLYSFSVKVEDDSQLNSADEIATAVYHMLGRIQEDSTGFN